MNDDNEVLDAIEKRITDAGPIYSTEGLAQDILDIVKNGNSFVAMSEFAKREEEWARDIDDAEDRVTAAEGDVELLRKIRELLKES